MSLSDLFIPGYLPNGHHRVIANGDLAANGNAMHCPETIRQSLPVVSKYSTDNESPIMVLPEKYFGLRNRSVLNNVGYKSQMTSSRISDGSFSDMPSFATNRDWVFDETSVPEQCIYDYIHANFN